MQQRDGVSAIIKCRSAGVRTAAKRGCPSAELVNGSVVNTAAASQRFSKRRTAVRKARPWTGHLRMIALRCLPAPMCALLRGRWCTSRLRSGISRPAAVPVLPLAARKP